MNRAQKTEVVESVRDAIASSPLLILTDFKGSTVAQMDTLRRSTEEVGATFRVVKNTLCKRAIEGSDAEGLAEHLRGNIGIMFAGEDPIAAAKVFRTLRKENEHLETRAGFFEGVILDAAGVETVADLPSREELLSQLLATIQEGPRQVLGVIQGPARDLLNLLNNHAANLEGGA